MNECYVMKLLMKSKKKNTTLIFSFRGREGVWMNGMWWNSWWNIRTKQLHESPHLEDMKEYEWILYNETLDEI